MVGESSFDMTRLKQPPWETISAIEPAYWALATYAPPSMANDLGPWRALDLDDVVQLFRAWPGRWWICGGVALELYLGRSWRVHGDSDVSILRGDAGALRDVLAGWDIQVAAAGLLTPWDGSALAADANQNNMWCRQAIDLPWCLDVTISEGDRDHWIYRRDPRLRVRWVDALMHTEGGVPYLAPELQLLFKSKNNRAKDDQDAEVAIPALGPERQLRLRDLLPPEHPWQALVVQ
jgi:hypothetical protein